MKETLAQWQAVTPLRREGLQWVGPCPACGGVDRFHVARRGPGTIVGCRGCMDGRPEPEKQAAFRRILRAAFEGIVQKPPEAAREADRRAEATQAARAGQAAREAERRLRQAPLRTHPYLAAKGHPGERYPVLGETLLIPVFVNGELSSLQMITPAGDKRFLQGSRVAGGCFALGGGRDRVVVEGIATALSVRDALRQIPIAPRPPHVVVAFSCWNLLNVARPGDLLVPDHDLPDKHGRQAGPEVAARAECATWLPPLGMDANDLHLQRGLGALVEGLRGALRGQP